MKTITKLNIAARTLRLARSVWLVAAVLAIGYITAWWVPVVMCTIDYLLWRTKRHFATAMAEEAGALIKGFFEAIRERAERETESEGGEI